MFIAIPNDVYAFGAVAVVVSEGKTSLAKSLSFQIMLQVSNAKPNTSILPAPIKNIVESCLDGVSCWTKMFSSMWP